MSSSKGSRQRRAGEGLAIFVHGRMPDPWSFALDGIIQSMLTGKFRLCLSQERRRVCRLVILEELYYRLRPFDNAHPRPNRKIRIAPACCLFAMLPRSFLAGRAIKGAAITDGNSFDDTSAGFAFFPFAVVNAKMGLKRAALVIGIAII